MTVMLSNNTGFVAKALDRAFSGFVGSLLSPGGQREPLSEFALDNGAYVELQGGKFDPEAWRVLLAWARERLLRPEWVLVPDAPGDRLGTLRRWDEFAAECAGIGPLAFALQDGMTIDDI